MSSEPTTPSESAASAEAAAPVADWTDRQLRLLEELTELAMKLARGLAEAELAAAGRPGKRRGDISLQFCRYAKAVRQCIALAQRIEADRKRGQAQAADRDRSAEREAARLKAQAKRLLETAIGTGGEAARGEADEREELIREARERLDCLEFGAAWADTPVAELVAGICRDLGVPFDPSPWTEEEPGLQAADAARRGAATPPAASPGRPAPAGATECGPCDAAGQAPSAGADPAPSGSVDPASTGTPGAVSSGFADPAPSGPLDPPPPGSPDSASSGPVDRAPSGPGEPASCGPSRPGSSGAADRASLRAAKRKRRHRRRWRGHGPAAPSVDPCPD